MFNYYLAVPVLLFLSAFLSGSETAVFSIRQEDISVLRKRNKRSAERLTKLIGSPQKTLFLILFLNIFINITLVGLITVLINHLVSENSAIISFVVSTLLLLVFGETIPKSIAINLNIKLASIAAPLLLLLRELLDPLLQLLKNMNSLLLDCFRLHLWKPDPYLTFEEFKNEIQKKKRNKEVTSEEADIILNLTENGSIPVKKSAVPISEIPFLPADESVSTGKELMKKHRSLICCLSSDMTKSGRSIHGLLHLAAAASAPGHKKAADLIIKPLWIPEHTPLAEACERMIMKKRESVCLLTEFGQFSGIAFLKDCLSTALHEKTETAEGSERVTRRVSGSDPPESAFAWLPDSMKNQAGNFATINGLLCSFIKRIPKKGEVLAIGDTIFYINNSEPNRIKEITLKKRKGKTNDN
ncbi:MAG: CNNM domain-containing protein [Chitinivibrionales bacterium]